MYINEIRRQAFYDLRAKGYSPIPMKRGAVRKPCIRGWPEFCTRQATDDEIEHWLRTFPECNVSIALGYDNVVAVDIDANEMVAPLEAVLPTQTMGKFGSKGLTTFYRSADTKSRTMKVNGRATIEFLGAGANTTVPPSIHDATGNAYRWVTDLRPASELPELPADAKRRCYAALVRQYGAEACAGDPDRAEPEPKPADQQTRTGFVDGRMRAYALAALDGEADKIASVLDGGRNTRVFDSACALGKYVHHGVLSEDEVIERVLGACGSEGNGLLYDLLRGGGEASIRASVASGFRKAANDPLPDIGQLSAEEMFGATPADTPPGGSLTPYQPAPVKLTPKPSNNVTAKVTLDQFYMLSSQNCVVYLPTGDFWSVDAFDRHFKTRPKASQWLAENQSATSVCWAPGQERFIAKHLVDGGWTEHDGALSYNMYRPATIPSGNAREAGPWVDHLKLIYPDDWEHLAKWFAYKVQYPQDKINHALVLLGVPGIGKDTVLRAVEAAVGPWNFKSIAPRTIIESQFNPYIRSVILRIDESHDLGSSNRYKFHDMMKTLEAAPPDVLLLNDKHVKAVPVLNVCGVIYTSNHLDDALYLPPDDRRHYVACSPLELAPEAAHFERLHHWLTWGGGLSHVAAWLRECPVGKGAFDPKAPPPKTPAFWRLAQADESEDAAELAVCLERMGHPDIVMLSELQDKAKVFSLHALSRLLTDPSLTRVVPHRLRTAGYEGVPNPDAPASGRWTIGGQQRKIYGSTKITNGARINAARQLTINSR